MCFQGSTCPVTEHIHYGIPKTKAISICCTLCSHIFRTLLSSASAHFYGNLFFIRLPLTCAPDPANSAERKSCDHLNKPVTCAVARHPLVNCLSSSIARRHIFQVLGCMHFKLKAIHLALKNFLLDIIAPKCLTRI